jgi:hypothetical protein
MRRMMALCKLGIRYQTLQAIRSGGSENVQTTMVCFNSGTDAHISINELYYDSLIISLIHYMNAGYEFI